MDLENRIQHQTDNQIEIGASDMMQLDTQALKDAMTVKFYSGARLAEETGITRQSVYRILRGENQPKPENFEAICRVLEVDPRDLLKEV